MDFMPLLPFLGVSIPESLTIYYMALTSLGRKESWLIVILLSTLTSLFSYIIRSIPVVFGIHSILQLILMMSFMIFLLKLPWRAALAAVILTSVLLGLAEGTFVPLLAWVFTIDLEQIISDPWLRILFTMPHLITLVAITYVFNKRQWRLPIFNRLMEGYGSIANEPEQRPLFVQTYLFVFCLLQALMLVLLNASFNIYVSGVYPSLTLDALVHISILVLMVGALVTIFIASYLLNTIEREAMLATELRHIKERHNLSVRLQVERHDFYNQLTSVYGYLKAGQYIKAESYIQRLYSKVGNIGSLLNLEPPELAALLSVKQQEAKIKGIDFFWDADIGGKNLPLSPEDLTHLMGNLLDNALEAARSNSSPRVDIAIKSNMMGLDLRVSNNGNNIPQDSKDIIFKAGYTTKDASRHSGLGLYIIKQIVDIHNGLLELKEPETYPGVEFRIRIPWNK